MSFQGKVAIVTGGSSGIGQAVAEALAAEGAVVAIVASSSIAKAASVCDAISTGGGRASPYVVDVRDAKAVQAVVAKVEADLGPIDLLVNAAGVFYPTPIGETPAEDGERLLDINLKGVWNCIQAVAPGMKQREQGKILNFASVAGFAAVRTFALYCASKAAVMMLTRAAAAELAPFGVNVNAIAPGNTATPMNEGFRQSGDPALDAIRDATPSRTTFSDPREIAGAALFLLSERGRPAHGSTWLMDEGVSAAMA